MAREFTDMALRAFTLADLVRIAFEAPIEGAVTYKVDLATPDGPSTAGGKQALQHLKLVPVPEGSGTTIVIGTANSVENVAELRSYAYLADMHAQRFKGASLPLDEKTYRALLAKMQGFFADRKMSVTMVDLNRTAAPAPPRSSSAALILLGLVLALVIVGGAAAFYLLSAR